MWGCLTLCHSPRFAPPLRAMRPLALAALLLAAAGAAAAARPPVRPPSPAPPPPDAPSFTVAGDRFLHNGRPVQLISGR